MSGNISGFEFDQFYGSLPFPVIISSLSGEIKYLNNPAKIINVLSAWSSDKILNLDDLHKINPAKWQKNKVKALESGKSSFTGKIHTTSGANLSFDVSVSKIQLDQNEMLLTVLRDTTAEGDLQEKYTRQEHWYRSIFNTIPATIFILDRENNITHLNFAFEEMSGLKIENVIGKNLIEIIKNDAQAEKNWKEDIEIIETGLPKRNIIEPFFWDKDRWFITDKIPLRSETGEITGILGFSIDITERKNVEDALVRSEKKFRQLFDTSPDGIVITDLNGNFKSANKAFLNLLEYNEDDITMLNFGLISKSGEELFELRFIHKALKSGVDSAEYEKSYLSKSNRVFPVRINCWIMRNKQGRPTQLGVYVRDISVELRAKELENSLLEKEKNELQQNLQNKTQQLNMKITQLIEKNELSNLVVNQLNRINTSELQVRDDIQRIVSDLKISKNDNFWGEFEATFGELNQTFYERLFQAFPTITKNERRLSAFLRMNLSTKDIANITHQTIRSIEMARSRLRQKFNLSRSENIYDFLAKF